MNTAIQFLEPGPHLRDISAADARECLQRAFERLEIQRVILGWNLPRPLVDSCAEECVRRGSELYLWQPLLAGDGVFVPRPEWHTVGLDGFPVAGPRGQAEFTFVCPNRPAVREAVLERLAQAAAGGLYRGVFLDRIRFPSPAEDPAHHLACFCEDCRRRAAETGFDLRDAQDQLRQTLAAPAGRRTLAAGLLSPKDSPSGSPMGDLMAFRRGSITRMVGEAAGLLRQRGLRVGLDCFTPALTRMVGQDLAQLSGVCDWIKGMTYLRALGPAGIPFEISALATWLRLPGDQGDTPALAWLADQLQWDFPADLERVRRNGLPAEIITSEVERGRAGCICEFLAGIELVEMSGICELTDGQIRGDAAAVRAAEPDGVVFSWDLWRMPPERLVLAGELYG